MNKCTNCGFEFEGKFCPNCGTKRETEKICPKCGTVNAPTARFCFECGSSLSKEDEPSQTPAPAKKPSRVKEKPAASETAATAVKERTPFFTEERLTKIYGVLKFVPAALFALFSVLAFAFFAAPVAIMPEISFFGETIPSESYGNVYSMSRGILSAIPSLKGAMITLIILGVAALFYSFITLAVSLLSFTQNVRVNLFNRLSIKLSDLLVYVSFAVYFVYLVMGCVICGKISAADEGMEIFAAGSCPKLIIAFSVVFAYLSAGVLVAKYFVRKALPEIAYAEKIETENAMASALELRALRAGQKQRQKETHAERLANLPAPAVPVEPVKVEKPLPTPDKIRADKRWGRRRAAMYMTALTPVVAIICSIIVLTHLFSDIYGGDIYVFSDLVLALSITIGFTLLFLGLLSLFTIPIIKKCRKGYNKSFADFASFNVWNTVFIIAVISFVFAIIFAAIFFTQAIYDFKYYYEYINDSDIVKYYYNYSYSSDPYKYVYGYVFRYANGSVLFFNLFIILLIYDIMLMIIQGVGRKHQKAFNLKYFGTKKPKFDKIARGVKVARSENPLNEELAKPYQTVKDEYFAGVAAYDRYRDDCKEYKRNVKLNKLENKLYARQKDYARTPAAVKFLWVHKVSLTVTAFLLVAAIIAASVVAPIFTNKFRLSNISKIELGYTQSEVREIMGDPYGDEEEISDTVWYYYGGSAQKLLNKIESNSAEQEKAMEGDNFNKLEKLVEEEEKLLEEFESLTYEYMVVNFTQTSEDAAYTVSGIIYDKNYCEASETTEKQVEKIEAYALYGSDSKRNLDQGFGYKILSDYRFTAKIYYADGSYQLKNFTPNVKSAVKNEDAVFTVKWKDSYAEYSVNVKIEKTAEKTN